MSSGQFKLRFSSARARKTDPRSSHDAAKKVNVTTGRQEILDLLAKNPDGLTTWELAWLTDRARDLVSPNMRPLERAGLIRRESSARVNPATGHLTDVFFLVDAHSNVVQGNFQRRER